MLTVVDNNFNQEAANDPVIPDTPGFKAFQAVVKRLESQFSINSTIAELGNVLIVRNRFDHDDITIGRIEHLLGSVRLMMNNFEITNFNNINDIEFKGDYVRIIDIDGRTNVYRKADISGVTWSHVNSPLHAYSPMDMAYIDSDFD